jgi:hypothetical protein
LDLARYFENIIWEAFTVSPWAIPTLVKIQLINGHFKSRPTHDAVSIFSTTVLNIYQSKRGFKKCCTSFAVLFYKWLNTGFWLPESKFYYTDIHDITREMLIAFILIGNNLNLLMRNGQDSHNIQVLIGLVFHQALYSKCTQAVA